jgi:hypothetical protein
MEVLLWIDDEREKPKAFTHWAKTSQEAIDILSGLSEEDSLVLISFDHDLAMDPSDGHPKLDDGNGYDDSRRVVEWMIKNSVWPKSAHVHSMNPIGSAWLYSVLNIEGPLELSVIRAPYNPRNYT